MLTKEDKNDIISLLINAAILPSTNVSVTDGKKELLKIEIKQGALDINVLFVLDTIFKIKVFERNENYVKVNILNDCEISFNLLEDIDSIYFYKNKDEIKLINKMIKNIDSSTVVFNRDVYRYFKQTKIFELAYKNLLKEIKYKMEIEMKRFELFSNIKIKLNKE